MINLRINSEKETERIVQFIQTTLKEQKFKKIIISLSGGIDSTTVLYLAQKALPKENILTVNFSHLKDYKFDLNIVNKLNIPKENAFFIPIKNIVADFNKKLKNNLKNYQDRLRLGNLVSRIRMIFLYDLAKKHQALVCGTENRSEHYLGYFTRFGDQASDIEPIKHLFKTQVYQLAEYLDVPQNIIQQQPTAGLWEEQTDKKELGFSYDEADPVLYLYFEKKLTINQIKKIGYSKIEIILNHCRGNEFKHKTPYFINTI